MSPRTILMLVIALGLAGGTAYLTRSMLGNQAAAPAPQASAPQTPEAAPAPAIRVLVAKDDLPAGTFLTPDLVEWRGWLYLLDDKRVARFNGVTYEFMFDLSSVGTTVPDIVVANDRLWFGLASTGDLTEVVGAGKYETGGLSGDYVSLFYYDGVGLFQYDEFAISNETFQRLMAFDGQCYVGCQTSLSSESSHLYTWDKDVEFAID
ncbi:MAG: hypothetical protein ACPGYL_08845, partial [Rhodospirillaceae bacterium]